MRWRLIARGFAGLALGTAAAGASAAQDTLRVQAPALTLAGPEAQETLTIETPPLTLTGPDEPDILRVDVPALSLAGPELRRVAVPTLSLVGPPVHPDIRVSVPSLRLVAAPPPIIKRIDVPRLTLVGPPSPPDTGVVADASGPVGAPGAAAGAGASGGAVRRWCGGLYSVSLSQPRAGAMAMGRREQTTANVTVHACASRMRVEVDGRAVDLTRGADGRFTGETSGGEGQTLAYTLTCEADFSLSGHMEARDRNIAVRREIEMTPTGGGASIPARCEPDPETGGEQR